MKREIIWADLEFFVKVLKGLPVSESLALSEKSYCVSTSTSSENWVYFPEDITSSEIVEEAVKFFRDRGEEFMWPLYSGGSEVLEKAGLVYAGDLTAMMLDPESMTHEAVNNMLEYERVSDGNADEWAMTSWRGFGGGYEEVPENYREFVRALCGDSEKVRLYLATKASENVGVFSLTEEAEVMGVYYFAVKPEFRRQGIAHGMMNEVSRLAGNKKVVLQSTPMGEKFYSNYGFKELFKMPVYSIESEIF